MERLSQFQEEVEKECAGSLTKTNIRFKNKRVKEIRYVKNFVCATIICQLLSSSSHTNPLISVMASSLSILDSASLGGEAEAKAETSLPLHNLLSTYFETTYTKDESSERRTAKQEKSVAITPEDSKATIVTSTESSTRDVLEKFIDKNYLSTGLLDAHMSQSPELMIVQPEADAQEQVNSILSKLQLSPSVNKHKQTDHFRYNSNGDWWTKLGGSNSPKSKPTNGHPQSVDTKTITNNKGDDEYTTKTERRKTKGGRKSTSAPATEKPSYRSGDNVGYKEQPLNQNQILTLKNQLTAIKSKDKLLVTKSIRQLQQLDGRLVDTYKLCLKKKMPLYAGMLYRTRDFVVRMSKDVKHERKVLEAMENQVQGILKQRMTNRTLVREYERLVETSTELTILNSSQTIVKQEKETQQQQQTKTAAAVAALPVRTKKDSSSGGGFNGVVARYLQELEQATTKKPKITVRYTVSINEVNFKKQLAKSQSLIDRIEKSTKELNSVVDDIIYLFKLSDNPKFRALGNRMKLLDNEQMTITEQRRAKKLLKSPIRVFLEKYGKLTMANFESTNSTSLITSVVSSGDNNSSNRTGSDLPDLKPIFEPASSIYVEKPEVDYSITTTVLPPTTTVTPTK